MGVQICTGIIRVGHDWLIETIGVVRPVIAYGLIVGWVRTATPRGGTRLATPPMPFGLAAAIAAFPWALLRPTIMGKCRLRGFGGRAVDAPLLLPVGARLETVVARAGAEIEAAHIALVCAAIAPI